MLYHDIKVCSICKSSHNGQEQTSWPYAKGRCCKTCFDKYVRKSRNDILERHTRDKELELFEAMDKLFVFHDLKQRQRYNRLKAKILRLYGNRTNTTKTRQD